MLGSGFQLCCENPWSPIQVVQINTTLSHSATQARGSSLLVTVSCSASPWVALQIKWFGVVYSSTTTKNLVQLSLVTLTTYGT